MASPRLVPSPPPTQALSSKTFVPPPLDGSITLPELFEWHLVHSPNHPLFMFSRENGDVRTIFWPEAVRAIHTGARLVRKALGWQPGLKNPPVVAILAAAGRTRVPFDRLTLSHIPLNRHDNLLHDDDEASQLDVHAGRVRSGYDGFAALARERQDGRMVSRRSRSSMSRNET